MQCYSYLLLLLLLSSSLMCHKAKQSHQTCFVLILCFLVWKDCFFCGTSCCQHHQVRRTCLLNIIPVWLMLVCWLLFFQGQVMFRNGERMGTIKFNQFQGTNTTNYSMSEAKKKKRSFNWMSSSLRHLSRVIAIFVKPDAMLDVLGSAPSKLEKKLHAKWDRVLGSLCP